MNGLRYYELIFLPKEHNMAEEQFKINLTAWDQHTTNLAHMPQKVLSTFFFKIRAVWVIRFIYKITEQLTYFAYDLNSSDNSISKSSWSASKAMLRYNLPANRACVKQLSEWVSKYTPFTISKHLKFVQGEWR